MILVDTNVIVATLIVEHLHHRPSVTFIAAVDPGQTVIAAHSFAEAYSTLTRPALGFNLDPARARDALDRVAGQFAVVALSAQQTLDAIRRFSAIGIGPRLYDYLIGATGIRYGADTIVTWNTRHFAGMFPQLRVVTPVEALPPPP